MAQSASNPNQALYRCQAIFRHQNSNQQDLVLKANKPFWTLKQENQLVYSSQTLDKNGDFTDWKKIDGEYLTILKQFWKNHIQGQTNKILFGFLGYDFADSITHLQHKQKNSQQKKLLEIPEACFMAFEEHEYLSFTQFCQEQNHTKDHQFPEFKLKSLISDLEYKDSVKAALELIKEGELYEINLSRPFFGELPKKSPSPFQISMEAVFYKTFWQNPAPFAGFFKFGDNTIVSASPECFLQKRANNLSTFPIKGTRPRHCNQEQNKQQIADLLSSPKELAEHLMVVDLERNDLGQIALPGSVKVKNFAELKSFEFVHHLVSEIVCELKDNVDIFAALKATFPSGSITGAPKIRTLEAIEALEKYKRQAYTGTLGFIDSDGDSTFSILIRSIFSDQNNLVLNVGGGIVADSSPEFECAETYVKCQGLL